MKNLFNLFALTTVFALASCGNTDDPDPVDPGVSDVIANLESGIMVGTLEEDYTLDASVQYDLNGPFLVAEGASLTIPAGTQIIADDGGTEVYIAVLKGADIFINGNPSNPVIMSSASGDSGDWGGLTICGEATTTAGVDATAEVGGFFYGGTNDADDSGHIKYLVIKGTGAQINSESQYNGISFYAVGNQTEVEYVSVINGADDGVEFFGGTVSVSNLYLENNDDDSIDWTESWSGGVTNAYITHSVPGFSTVFEGDKENANPTFTNITAISTVEGTALQFKKESGGSITGLYLEGYAVDLDMKDDGALSNVQIDGQDPDATLIDGETSKYTLNSGKDSPKVDISEWAWKDAGL
ncbi:MAG: hypothetical protein ACPGR7_05375 [Flavobacteriaceae bacterium]